MTTIATGIARTPDEILARVEQVKASDWMGTQTSDLLGALPYEQLVAS